MSFTLFSYFADLSKACTTTVGAFLIMFAIFTLASIISWLVEYDKESKDAERWLKYFKKGIIGVIIVSILFIAIPSKTTIYVAQTEWIMKQPKVMQITSRILNWIDNNFLVDSKCKSDTR